MIIHQIWLGDKIPPNDCEDMDRVISACSCARAEYKLWGQEELWARYGEETATRELDRLRPHLPAARFAALAADWFRLRVLADFGGVYFDTDIQLTTGAVPPLPDACDIYFFPDGRRDDGCSNCAIVAVGERGRTAAAELAALSTAQLCRISAQDCASKWGLMWAIGPTWLWRNAFPELRGKGYSVGLLSRALCSDHGGTRPLNHRGSGKWVRAAGASMPAPSLCAAPLPSTHGEVERAMKAQRGSCPPWLRAQGGVAVTRPTASAPAETAQEAPQAAADSTAARHFALPDWVRRVVVFSNVAAECVPLAPLGLNEGDLCIHIGSCKRHAEAVATAAREHWCVVRHGSGFRWYTPPTFNGFRRVVFVDSVLKLSPFAWWRAYKEANKDKSPTTGFLVANIIRELRPDMPLVLAGFAPGTPCGTPLWSGHAWDFEKSWYTAHGFDLRAPILSPNK